MGRFLQLHAHFRLDCRLRWRRQRPEGIADMFHGFLVLRRAQKFPEAASFRMTLTSSASASSLFSQPFSFSRSLSRRAWSTFRPPYSFRQR